MIGPLQFRHMLFVTEGISYDVLTEVLIFQPYGRTKDITLRDKHQPHDMRKIE